MIHMEQAKQKRTVEEGILMRGPDGALYHIPLDALVAYKLSGERAESVKKSGVFDRQTLGRVTSPRGIGLSSDEEPTQTGIVDLSAILR
jgi:hypothetical protein